MRRYITLVLALLALTSAATASTAVADDSGCNTRACFKRFCAVVTCKERVEFKWYKKHPLPYCTWGPESNFDPARGISYHGQPWALGRYVIMNGSGSGAAGKYQIMRATWLAFGGGRYASAAQLARPVTQERIARRIARDSLSHWVNC